MVVLFGLRRRFGVGPGGPLIVPKPIRVGGRRRDSDRSGEAGETRSGSTEGESAGPQDIAQPEAATKDTQHA